MPSPPCPVCSVPGKALEFNKNVEHVVSEELQGHQAHLLESLRRQLHSLLQEHHDIILREVECDFRKFDQPVVQRMHSRASAISAYSAGRRSQLSVPSEGQHASQRLSADVPLASQQPPATSTASALKGSKTSDQGNTPCVNIMEASNEDVQSTPTSSASLRKKRSTKSGKNLEDSRGAQWIVERPMFEIISTILILINMAVMAGEAQYQGEVTGHKIGHPSFNSAPGDAWKIVWFAISCFFNLAFLIELIFRLVAARLKALTSFWLWLDFILVIVGAVNFLDSLKIVSFGFNVSVLRLMRVMRVFRALRMGKILKESALLQSLLLLFKSVQAALNCSFWSFMLLLLIITASGLLANQALIQDIEEKKGIAPVDRFELFDYFGTFTKTFITMFELTTANWPTACRLLMRTLGDGWGIMVVLYRCLFCFAVVNIIGAVFIAETHRVSAADDDVAAIAKDRQVRKWASKITSMFENLDPDGEGLVSWEDFRSIMHDDATVAFMNTLDLTPQDCHTVFTLLDEGAGGITCEEFIEGTSNIHGYAKRIDVATLLKRVRDIDVKLESFLQNVSEKEIRKNRRAVMKRESTAT